MAKRVHKYPITRIAPHGFPALWESKIHVPFDFVPFAVQLQETMVCAWGVVDSEQPADCERTAYIVPTGEAIEFDLSTHPHAGTIQVGPYVWHVFIER